VVVATAYADELSLRALADIAEITADQDVRIVGGHMVSLLLTAFPVSGITTQHQIRIIERCTDRASTM